jgi:hypothetical protein
VFGVPSVNSLVLAVIFEKIVLLGKAVSLDIMSQWPEDEEEPRKSAWRLISAFIFAKNWSEESVKALKQEIERLKRNSELTDNDLAFLTEHKRVGASDEFRQYINWIREILDI